MTFRKWIAALLSLAILCTALAIISQPAAACPAGCACNQGGPCTCPAGSCDNSMCANSPAYSNAQGSSSGFFPTTMPQFPGRQPGYPMPINRTPGAYPTMFPRPTITPGMPMPTMYPRPTIGPGMPTQFPGMPFPGRTTPTPVPTEIPTVTPLPTPVVMPP
ncbi:MAG: hypothetical protein WBZ29_13990 [Methanocella sp.]